MPRTYNQTSRAEATERRRERMIEATRTLLGTVVYDSLTLQSVADAAGVSLKTVVRHFGTKEELFRAVIRSNQDREATLRAVPVGDVGAAVRVLCERYEALGGSLAQWDALAERDAFVAEAFGVAAAGHRAWLEEVFAPWLGGGPAQRESRILALYWATEVRAYAALGKFFGADRRRLDAVMSETLTALIAKWEGEA